MNYEGVIVLSTGEIFAANAHRSYFMLSAYFYLHHILDKNSHVEALFMEKSKAEKSPWVKKMKKTGPKKKEIPPFCQRKKNNLAESHKGSWFRQRPWTISATAEDPEQATILGASTLKFEVIASVGCEQVSSLESGGSNEEKEECETNGPKHWSIVDRDQLN